MVTPDSTKRRSAFALALFAIWTVPGAVLMTQEHLWGVSGRGAVPPVLWLASWTLPMGWPWIGFTFVVRALARRFPLSRDGEGSVAARVMIHVASAGVIGVAHLALYALLLSKLRENATPITFAAMFESLAWRLWPIVELLFYAGVAATTWHLDSRREVAERERHATRLEAELARAQLGALRMQLQPHFLFNTMNSIAVLMREDVAAAERMLVGLSDLLRLTLERDGATHPLADELDWLQRYLDIEAIRFPDRLVPTIDVAPDCLDVEIPAMLLQPLVENALRHGIARRLDAGRLSIRVERNGARLRVRVEDDGAGLRPDWSDGIGLSNTRDRLERIGGVLRLSALEGGGTRAEIELAVGATS